MKTVQQLQQMILTKLNSWTDASKRMKLDYLFII